MLLTQITKYKKKLWGAIQPKLKGEKHILQKITFNVVTIERRNWGHRPQQVGSVIAIRDRVPDVMQHDNSAENFKIVLCCP